MKLNGTRLTLACLAIAALAVPAGFAQQQQQSSIPDQYQGVSHPPLDDQIVATPDTPAPAAARPKPSPAIPASSAIAAPPPSPPAAAATSGYNTSAPAAYTTARNPAVTSIYSDTHRWDNTDYGIVTIPVPPGQDNPDIPLPSDPAVLHVRQAPSPSAIGPSNELPAGAQIRIRIAEALSTDSTQVGAPFHGRVIVNVMQGGSVIIPAGSTLRGRVVEVSQGHHFGSAATLRLRPEIVVLPDGTAYHIYGQVEYSNADNTRVGSEGGIRPESHAVRNTVEYGAGIGTGAVVGAALAGPPGALAGTIVGAGIITTHLLMQQPDAASIPAGSDITFGLTEPLYLIPTQN